MRIKRMISIFGGMVLGGGAGLFFGALLGGNLATNFEFVGLRGYEATGIVGLALGIASGGFSGARLTK